jgi:hypothetical protein
MTPLIAFHEGTTSQLTAAKQTNSLKPKSFYLIDGQPYLALSASTVFAFVDTIMVSQMIAGLSGGGSGVQLGTMSGKAPTTQGTPGTSLLAAHEDHTHSAQTDITGNANTATTAGSASKLTTPRTIRLAGVVTGTGTFSGEVDCTIQTILSMDQVMVPHWFGTESELPAERDPNTVYMVYE